MLFVFVFVGREGWREERRGRARERGRDKEERGEREERERERREKGNTKRMCYNCGHIAASKRSPDMICEAFPRGGSRRAPAQGTFQQIYTKTKPLDCPLPSIFVVC